MDLIGEIEELGKMLKSLREENRKLKGKTRLLIEREDRALEKLKSVVGDVDNLLSTQGKTRE